MNKHRSEVYIPENLDLNELLVQRPPVEITKFSKDKLAYIIGLISSIPVHNKRLSHNSRYVPIHAATLQNHIKDYRQYFNYLIRCGIIDSNHQYIPGEHSIGYAFTSEYTRFLKPEPISSYTLSKLVRFASHNQDTSRQYQFLTKWFTGSLQIDKTAADEYLYRLYQNNCRIPDGTNPVYKYNYSKTAIENIYHQNFYYGKDDNVGRFHSNLTNLKSVFRNFITFDGQPLVSVDIKNSQLCFSGILLNENFYKNFREPKKVHYFNDINHNLFDINHNLFNINDIIIDNDRYKSINKTNRLNNIISYIMIGKDELSHDSSYFQLYTQKSEEGLIYEYISDEVFRQSGRIFKDRKELKEIVFTALFTDNRFIAQPEAEPKRIFRDTFPPVYNLFSLIKKGDSTVLPRLLQTIEAKLMLDHVALRISREKPYLPIYTIHDSIVCPVGYEQYVSTVIQEEMIQAIGISPTLKCDRWSPDVINACKP